MIAPEEKAREKLLKKILKFSLLGSSFSITATLVASIMLKDVSLFLAYVWCILIYATLVLLYYFTFVKAKLSIKKCNFIFLSISAISLTFLTYFAGGFSGAMISTLLLYIIVTSMLVDKREAMYIFSFIFSIYLLFLFGETYNVITPLITDVTVIKYSKAIIDMLSFFAAILLISIISQTTKDSINFYRLRSIRLSKIRKRLEFLVKRRTRELEESNKELEEARNSLRKSYKELQKLDVKKDEFISIAAHELKTPLTAIGGYSQLLKNRKIVKNEKKRKEFLDILDKESRRLSQLVTEILNLSRIDLGVMKYYIEEVDIYELMKEIENEFAPKLNGKGLNYKFNLEKNLPKMKTDRGKLYEIMTNLLSNAVKYTLKGRINVDAYKKGKFIQFSIADTGIGISRKNYSDVFKRFSPIDTSLKREAGGTGLGLSLCKEYVKKLGGKIWFKSKLGKGSMFYVKLPIESRVSQSLKPV